jgi:hypothetical protein
MFSNSTGTTKSFKKALKHTPHPLNMGQCAFQTTVCPFLYNKFDFEDFSPRKNRREHPGRSLDALGFIVYRGPQFVKGENEFFSKEGENGGYACKKCQTYIIRRQ